MSLPDKLKSPKKLQRSIYNQLQGFSKSLLYHNHIISDGSQSVDLSLSLRNINLVLTLPSTLLHIKPQADLITSLDLSYSLTDDNTLAEFCYRIPRLKHLQAVECGLEEVNETTPWPKGLRTINLSRNRLKMCPCGIANLFLLAALNLSGNRIENFDPTLLHLPYLEKLYLLKNPIANVPKHVCRLGVFELRQFFKIKPLSLSASPTSCYNHEWQRVPSGAFKVHPNLRQYMLKPQGPQPSLDSGYDSETSRRPSCSSSASLYDIESIDIGMDRNVWPPFTPSCLPQGYTCVHSSRTKHCQVYLPNDCSADVTIEIVKDVSFHPLIEANNKFLITPVVQITPHGLVFNPDKPAIIVLNHCTKPNEYLRVTPLCSNTSHYQSPNWINLKTKCEVFHDCVMFETTHFSLFTAIGVLPYPSTSVEIHQHEGGSLYLPQVPGLEIYIPPNSLPQHVNTTITATAYYNDHPYAIDHNERAIASTCLELKPHQIQFSSPVQVSLPIPDYLAIKTNFPDAQLQLWHSSSTQDAPNNWECIENHVITVHEEGDGHIATFTTTHFSFFELLWTVCKYPLAQLGLGASHFFTNLPNRARYISVRCQTFMSRPLCDLSFGLVVIAYKFGDPILELSNYPWLVADSGSKRVFLKIGELCVSLTGCFDVREGFGEKLSHTQQLMEFNGEDFCLRFEFALRFDEGVCLPLPDGKILGKVQFTQWMGSNPVNHDYNIITPSEKKDTNKYLEPPSSPELTYQSSTQNVYYTNADFTPPWSPDSDIHMECETSMCPPMPSSDTMTMTTTPAASSNIRRKRPRFVSTNSFSNHSESVKRQIFIRRDSISDKILMEISHKASYKYLELGLQLGLNYSTIQNSVGCSSHKGEHLKTFTMLQEWKSRAADEYTFSTLAHALEQVGLTSLAREFCYTC